MIINVVKDVVFVFFDLISVIKNVFGKNVFDLVMMIFKEFVKVS